MSIVINLLSLRMQLIQTFEDLDIGPILDIARNFRYKLFTLYTSLLIINVRHQEIL